MILDVYRVAQEAGKEVARLEGRLTEIYNSSTFSDKTGKEIHLNQYQQTLERQKEIHNQIDEVTTYLNKLLKDISKFKPGYFKNRIHAKRINKLKKDIAEEVEIVKKEIKLLEAPKVFDEVAVSISPETKEKISKYVKEVKSEKEIQEEVKSVRDRMEVKKYEIKGSIKDIRKFEI